MDVALPLFIVQNNRNLIDKIVTYMDIDYPVIVC